MLRVGIVMGVDYQGKSTLIELVRKISGCTVRKIVASQEAIAERSKTAFLRRAAQDIRQWSKWNGLVVYDRFPYPDDFVYRIGISQLTTDVCRSWEEAMTSRCDSVRIVYVYPPTLPRYFARVRHAPVNRDHIDLTQEAPKLLEAYDKFLSITSLPFLRLSSDDWFSDSDALRVYRFFTDLDVEWTRSRR